MSGWQLVFFITYVLGCWMAYAELNLWETYKPSNKKKKPEWVLIFCSILWVVFAVATLYLAIKHTIILKINKKGSVSE